MLSYYYSVKIYSNIHFNLFFSQEYSEIYFLISKYMLLSINCVGVTTNTVYNFKHWNLFKLPLWPFFINILMCLKRIYVLQPCELNILFITTMSTFWASLIAQLVKNMPAMLETWLPSLGCKDPLEKREAAHSSILASRIPQTI